MSASKNKLANKARRTRRFGWHFLSATKRLGYGDERKVKTGVRLKIRDHQVPVLCQSGMHASFTILNASIYEKGPVLCRVVVQGDLVTSPRKFCGRSRTVLWMRKIDKRTLQRLFVSLGMSSRISESLERLSFNKLFRRLRMLRAEPLKRAEAWLVAWAKRNGCPK